MNDIVNLLGMDWRSGLLFVAALIIVFIWIIDKWNWIVTKFGLQTRASRRETKQDEDIAELKEHAKKTDENFEKILSSVDGLQQSIKDLSNQVKAMEVSNKKGEIARIKDRISQAYNHFKIKGEWSSMEREAFDGLINALNEAGEHNSFCNEIAYPKSREWTVIDE